MKSPHERLEAVLPELRDELEAAALADQVVLVRIGRTGRAASVRLIPRAELAACGDGRMAKRATVKPGEFAACWVVGELEDVPGDEWPIARAGLQGASDWPPKNLEELLRQRTRSLMPSLGDAIRRASEADEVLMLAFTGRRVWSMRKGLMPRADLVARGDKFCAQRAPLHAGEAWSCWAVGVDTATGRYVAVRLYAMPQTKGGTA